MKRYVYRFENKEGDVVLSVSERKLFRRKENLRVYCGEKYPVGRYLWRRESFAGHAVEGRLADWLTFETHAQILREGSERMTEMIRELRKVIDEKVLRKKNE